MFATEPAAELEYLGSSSGSGALEVEETLALLMLPVFEDVVTDGVSL
ncbi:hypothetical protein M7I_3990 [Glarea lozoyensis 74030]|uniref:Uncharacterized protein n=1 Tax=Glarea lozoyensis (strain ATCC 74030 / MF5533) TaxID=1104152 RepID=H0EMZ1_GLAL7|nr:hypothetical protein M7I_3990 [Glarea lozoyensis 74030]